MENKLIPNSEKKELKPDMHKKTACPESLTTVDGVIEDWTFNNDYIYNGFILEVNSEKIWVKFPPHLGKQLKDNFNINDYVSVKGVFHTTPKGDKEIKFISLKTGDKEIFDTPPTHCSVNPEFIKGEGKVTQVLRGKKEEIIGYVIDTTTIIKILTHENVFFENKIQIDTSIKFTGIKKVDKEGEVKAKEYSIIYPKTITIEENEYLIK